MHTGLWNFKTDGLIGRSQEIQNVLSVIEKVADTDSTVLITGESGTGKELVARTIHEKSPRCPNPMVTINCSAIPGELLESELFGHEKGAFTGAYRSRIGRFELADGGTLFLDEVGDMSPSLQVKLLRVLQEFKFERVGSVDSIKVDVRVLAATNKNLEKSINTGEFREDLFYRLNVIPIRMAPLRNRRSDIPLLIEYFQNKMVHLGRKGIKTFSDEAMEALMAYDWPGNIRELENLMERMTVLVEHNPIEASDLPDHVFIKSGTPYPSASVKIEDSTNFNDAVEKYQRDLILKALNQTHWVKAKAAQLLKINRTTLVEKIKKMKIEPDGNEFHSSGGP